MLEPIATPIAARLLALAAMRAGTLRLLGDVPGHEFHGNQYTSGTADEQVGKFISDVADLGGDENTLEVDQIVSKLGVPIVGIQELSVASQQKGVGTRIMKKVVEAADKHSVTLLLNAEPLDAGISSSKLREFYTRFGFKPTTAYKKEMPVGNNVMVRTPVKQFIRGAASSRPGQRQLHAVADAQFPAISVAVRYAFAEGRKAVKGKSADAVAKAVRKALLDVLPGTLARAMAAGGDAGLAIVQPKLRTEVKVRAASAPNIDARLQVFTGPYKIRFDARDPRAAAWAKEHALELADGLSETTRLAVKAALEAALEGDGDLGDVMAAVGDDARAEVIARTESMRAVSEGQRQGWQQAVDKGLLDEGSKRVWIATAGACPICDDLDGQETTLSDEYPDPGGEGPPQHPNCILPGSVVSGRFVAGLRAYYQGPAREIETANGNRLRLTIQHPVLTSEGWIEALSIRKGMQLVCQLNNVDRTTFCDDYQRPTLIEDVFETMAPDGLSAIEPRSLDLHGDARHVQGKIDVVRPKLILLDDVPSHRSKSISDFSLPQSDVVETRAVSFSSGQLSLESVRLASSSEPCTAHLSNDGVAVLEDVIPFQVLLFGLASQWNVPLSETARQDVTVNAAFILELQKRSAGKVAYDEVVKVRDFEFFGHVYDLQSDCGFIIAQNIVISNCRCTEGISA